MAERTSGGVTPVDFGGQAVAKERLVKPVSGGSFWGQVVVPAVVILVVVFGGVVTGWWLAQRSLGKTEGAVVGRGGVVAVAPGVEGGSGAKGVCHEDEATFRDKAEGTLKAGGMDGEGTHHLEREGGPSQSVYLTSTVVDLESFVDKRVEVRGETMQAQKAGWLMDVGCVKPIE